MSKPVTFEVEKQKGCKLHINIKCQEEQIENIWKNVLYSVTMQLLQLKVIAEKKKRKKNNTKLMCY